MEISNKTLGLITYSLGCLLLFFVRGIIKLSPLMLIALIGLQTNIIVLDGKSVKFYYPMEAYENYEFLAKENKKYKALYRKESRLYFEKNCNDSSDRNSCRAINLNVHNIAINKILKERIVALESLVNDKEHIDQTVMRRVQYYNNQIETINESIEENAQELKKAKLKIWENGREERIENEVIALRSELKALKEQLEVKEDK